MNKILSYGTHWLDDKDCKCKNCGGEPYPGRAYCIVKNKCGICGRILFLEEEDQVKNMETK